MMIDLSDNSEKTVTISLDIKMTEHLHTALTKEEVFFKNRSIERLIEVAFKVAVGEQEWIKFSKDGNLNGIAIINDEYFREVMKKEHSEKTIAENKAMKSILHQVKELVGRI